MILKLGDRVRIVGTANSYKSNLYNNYVGIVSEIWTDGKHVRVTDNGKWSSLMLIDNVRLIYNNISIKPKNEPEVKCQ